MPRSRVYASSDTHIKLERRPSVCTCCEAERWGRVRGVIVRRMTRDMQYATIRGLQVPALASAFFHRLTCTAGISACSLIVHFDM